MVVTVTNLGSGEVRPRSVLARIVVGFGALVGIVTTALWVNVFSKFLELPHEERRILAMVEHQRKLQHSVGFLIQAWRDTTLNGASESLASWVVPCGRWQLLKWTRETIGHYE